MIFRGAKPMRPKRLVDDLVRKWIKLDRLLLGEGATLAAIADELSVDPKTVRRWLTMFRQLGHSAKCYDDEPGRVYRWRYQPGTVPIFMANAEAWES